MRKGKIFVEATKDDVHCNVYGRLKRGQKFLIDEAHFDADYMKRVNVEVVAETKANRKKKGGDDK